MRVKSLCLVCTMLVGAIALAEALPQNSSDPLTGTWTGDWGPSPEHRNQATVQLKWDGTNLTGTVNPGEDAVPLEKCTFDPQTGSVHMEADAKNRRGDTVHYLIDGKVEGSTMTGTWNHGSRKGDFKLTKQ